MDTDKAFSLIQAKLAKNYEKQIQYLAMSDRIKSAPFDAHWLQDRFERMMSIRKQFEETENMIRIGRLSYPIIISETSRKVLDMYVKGEFGDIYPFC